MSGGASGLQVGRGPGTPAAAGIAFDRLPSGIVVLRVETPHASASISLFGGQVLTWRPKHTRAPVLWMSDRAVLDGTKAIRGGVPICWPWFGAHPQDRALPAHGYARIHAWHVDRVQLGLDGEVQVDLSLSDEAGPATGRLPLRLAQTIRIGATLDIALTSRNAGAETVVMTEGLHTYFQIGDIDEVAVGGLDARDYIDLTAANIRRRQDGDIRFTAELGRIFVDTAEACTIEDPRLQRRIRVEKSGSARTAVWNPWRDVAASMSDLGAEGWRTMVCVETANALQNAIALEPGQSHTLTARYSVEPLPR
jgi:glucose-6-phosphate 1-epimerase